MGGKLSKRISLSQSWTGESILCCLCFLIALKGLFIPVDLIFFRNELSQGLILITTITGLFFLRKSKRETTLVPHALTLIGIYLAAHCLISPQAALTNIRYGMYIIIIYLFLNRNIRIMPLFSKFAKCLAPYLALALILHSYLTMYSVDLQGWSVDGLQVFESNNDVYNKIMDDTVYYAPYYFVLVGEWFVYFGEFKWLRFTGYGPEPTDLAMLCVPLIFVCWHYLRQGQKKLLMPIIIFVISIFASLSIAGILALTIGFLFVRIAPSSRNKTLQIIALTALFMPIMVINKMGLFSSITEMKVSEFVYYTQELGLITNLSTTSLFGAGIQSYDEGVKRSYGFISILSKYGTAGFAVWVFLIVSIFNQFIKLWNNEKTKILAAGGIASLFLSLKGPDIVTIHLLLYYCMVAFEAKGQLVKNRYRANYQQQGYPSPVFRSIS